MKYRGKVSTAAVALYVGTAIGAGVFGIPFAVAKAGFWVGSGEIIILGILMILMTLAYGEVVLRTKEKHQLIGYAEKYIGKKGRLIALITVLISMYSALTAYTIESGVLLHAIFSSSLKASEEIYSFIFLLILSTIVFFGVKSVVWVEKTMVVILLLVLVLIIQQGIGEIEPQHFTNLDIRYIFLPYGVTLFALAATSAVPDMRRIIDKKRSQLKYSIILGGLIPILVYTLFSWIVVGVSGQQTSESALLGLGEVLGGKILVIGSVFGLLTMSTSFVALGLILKETYEYDFRIPKIPSWLLVVCVPLIITLLKIASFIQILSIGGAVIGGCEGLLILRMHAKAREKGDRQPEYTIRFSKAFRWALAGIFIGGIIYELFVVL